MSNRRTVIWTIALAITFFAAIAPTLRWLEFCTGLENLNIATVLELRRGSGTWLLPTLEGRARIEKPPLTAWITAVGTRESTTASLDDPDPAVRADAYQRLAFDIRWTALLSVALTILATYALARVVARGDGEPALAAAVACATNYFVLRFARSSMTDVQLMLWVTLANVFIARCMLDRITWPAALGAGAALGLAFMAKGPVALVQTVVPAIVYMLIARWRGAPSSPAPRMRWAPVIGGIALMLAIGLWWFIVIALRVPDVIGKWLSETNPAGGDRLSSSNPFTYAGIFAFVMPWSAFLVHGIIASIFVIARKQDLRSTYPTILLLTTILVMSCFADRKDRYMLPMAPIAAVIAGQSVAMTWRRAKDSLPDWAHWVVLFAFALFPLLGLTTVVKTIDGGRWFTPTFAVGASLIALAIVTIGWLATRRSRAMLLATPVVLMLYLQAVGVHGYSKSREGKSEMRPLAQLIRERYPDAQMFNYRGERDDAKRAPVDLSIYLNRSTLLTTDPSALPPSDRTEIYVTLQGRRDPEPQIASGWTFLHKVKRDKDWYWAFVRPAPAPAPPDSRDPG